MRYVVALLLLLGFHFSLTASVPAAPGQAWLFWPFAADSRSVFGVLGEGLSPGSNILSVVAALCFIVAAVGLFWDAIPASWWTPLVVVGVIASAVLFILYFGVWAILPLALDAVILWDLLTQGWSAAELRGY